MIKLTILGNNSAVPAHGRHPTAQVIEIKDQLFLMDCGEGTQIQMQRYKIKKSKINYIFISHLHGDHYYGLIGLITSMGLTGRINPLYVFGPPGLKEVINLHLEISNAKLPYLLIFEEISTDQSGVILESQDFEVRCFPVEHRIPCHGFIFSQRNKDRKINPEKCTQLNVPFSFYPQLKKGIDFEDNQGNRIQNEELTFSPDPEKTYVFCADTRFTESFLPYIQEADLLYHESTFLNIDAEKASTRFHSTAGQAAQIALLAKAKRLLLGHYSSRYIEVNSFYLEAKEIFSDVEVSIEGMTYEI